MYSDILNKKSRNLNSPSSEVQILIKGSLYQNWYNMYSDILKDALNFVNVSCIICINFMFSHMEIVDEHRLTNHIGSIQSTA